MNRIFAVALLIIMALLLLLCVKKLFPSAIKMIRVVYIIFIVVISCFMVYLLWYLINGVPFGSTGSPAQETDEQTSIDIVLSPEKLEDCIVLRDDKIYIDDELIEDMGIVEAYISQRANDNVEIVIVDDYSLASLHHEITELCRNKGANIRPVRYEEWINDQ